MCAFVHGFEPYFYIESPLDFSADDCDSLRSLLDVSPPWPPAQIRTPLVSKSAAHMRSH